MVLKWNVVYACIIYNWNELTWLIVEILIHRDQTDKNKSNAVPTFRWAYSWYCRHHWRDTVFLSCTLWLVLLYLPLLHLSLYATSKQSNVLFQNVVCIYGRGWSLRMIIFNLLLKLNWFDFYFRRIQRDVEEMVSFISHPSWPCQSCWSPWRRSLSVSRHRRATDDAGPSSWLDIVSSDVSPSVLTPTFFNAVPVMYIILLQIALSNYSCFDSQCLTPFANVACAGGTAV